MTEQEWLECTEPRPMLEYLRGKGSERKLRLFARACVRQVWHLLTDERSRNVVEVAERYADGLATEETLSVADQASQAVTSYYAKGDAASAATVAASKTGWNAGSNTVFFAGMAAALDAERARSPIKHWQFRPDWASPEESARAQAKQAALLRDIFGNPFRPFSLNPSWLIWHDGLIPSMAWSLYDSRDLSHMPILADALEEAGCQDTDILGHCRSDLCLALIRTHSERREVPCRSLS